VMVGLSSSIPEGMEPLPKKAHLGSFLRVSSQYACGVTCCLCGSCISRLLP
jgi:adenine C2-methylase RlmN of 23S rRNA A2503 and tRNA A37